MLKQNILLFRLKMLHNRKVRTEAMEKMQKSEGDGDSAVDSPMIHKDELLDEEENEMSENESVGTQPEEVSNEFQQLRFCHFKKLYIKFMSAYRRKTINYLVRNLARSWKNC